MGEITVAMLKRRSEHNDGVLHDLEELVLQEEGLERIDKILGKLCPHLKYLYMPNNIIARIENLHRLKELKYLNLALNNITKIEGLEQCESLEKLDLTLNFVGQNELFSVSKLACNVRFRELFLTGNPCHDLPGYRHFVIAVLPYLKRLDGVEIKPSERIRARQEIDSLVKELEFKSNVIVSETTLETSAPTMLVVSPSITSQHIVPIIICGILKRINYITTFDLEMKKDRSSEITHQKLDLLNMLSWRSYGKKIDCKRRWSFKLTESECKSKIMLDIPVGRFMDISFIEVDVQPTLVRVLVKGKLLQLLLPEEVNPDRSIAQRSTTTGNLLISMPKAITNAYVKMCITEASPIFYSEKPKEQMHEMHHVSKEQHDLDPLSQKMLEHEEPRQQKSDTRVIDEVEFDDLPELE